MSQIVLDQISRHFVGCCYPKLTVRERGVVDFLCGIDVLSIVGNKVTKGAH